MFCKIVIDSLITITTLICKIPLNLPLPAFRQEKDTKGRNYPSLANGSTRLTILSLSKERGDLPVRSRFGEGRGEIF
jgi:hypothetical protein